MGGMRNSFGRGGSGTNRSSRIFTLSHRQTVRLRQVVVTCVICLAIYCFVLAPPGRQGSDGKSSSSGSVTETYSPGPESPAQNNDGYNQPSPPPPSSRELPPELLENRSLTEAQCRASFPGLLKEVDDAVGRGPFTLSRSSSGLGPLIARIRDGQLYVLSAARKSDLSKDMLAHRSATLHQIAAALLTAPHPRSASVPDTVFAFNHHDDPLPSTLSYSRPADPALLLAPDRDPSSQHQQQDQPQQQWRHYFPIPHFSFYAWPLPFVGSFARASRAIAEIEDSLLLLPPPPSSQSSSSSNTPGSSGSDDDDETPAPPWWRAKRPLAVWRGTTWFNNPRAGRLRQGLVAAARGKPWADVEPLRWTSSPSSSSSSSSANQDKHGNALPISDFCRYRYVVHTEGVTYSGRFQFHSLCASVVLAPPVAWMQHLTHLLRPAFSYALEGVKRRAGTGDGDGEGEEGKAEAKLAPYPAPWVRQAWPRSYAPEEANIVFVAPDWSDLESTVAWLEARPAVAAGIAARQRELFHGGGYFSPAAEMCYWRALLKGWAAVVRTDGQGFEDLEEMPWEEFSLKEIHK